MHFPHLRFPARARLPRAGLGALFVFAIVTGGCAADSTAPDPERVGRDSAPQITNYGYIPENGMGLTFAEVVNPTGLDLQNTVGIAACGPTTLYATTFIGFGYALYFSNDSGQSWKSINAYAFGPEIACDHSNLATLNPGDGSVWTAPLLSSGLLTADSNNVIWRQQPNTAAHPVDRIQGGDGSFYGVKKGPNGNQLYVSSLQSINAALTWTPISTIGATVVTGTGATVTGSDSIPVYNSLAWPRRAFTLEVDGTVNMNDHILEGNNLWTSLGTGSERFTALTAGAPNVLYGLQTRNGAVHLDRITMAETSCFDGVDNDANGLTDGEDGACTQIVANSFCSSHANGTYCADRFQPSWYMGQSNQNTSLVACSGGQATISPGVCAHGFTFNHITFPDYLVPLSSLTPPDPSGFGHWCNVRWDDGSWDVDWNGATPCDTLKGKKPGLVPRIVRAGLYSISGTNNALVACNNGGVGPVGSTGAAPLAYLYNAVGHTTNSCVFTVSPTSLPVFGDVYYAGQLAPNRGLLPFIHSLSSPFVDRVGQDYGKARETAYDLPLDEGRPLLALGGGVVVKGGSRERDITANSAAGSPNQGELYVQYSIGSDPNYQETFVAYYAHVRKRIVVDGQTVKEGQILGYVGATGATGGYAHLHMGVFRLSNINAQGFSSALGYGVDLGWHAPFAPSTDSTGNNMGSNNAVDPLGWGVGSYFDPWGYAYQSAGTGYGFTGIGAWSPTLFKPGYGFSYP